MFQVHVYAMWWIVKCNWIFMWILTKWSCWFWNLFGRACLCLNCNGGLKPHLELSKFFSSLKHEIFHSFNKFNTMNRGIMLCFSMIIDFFSVVIAMSIVVCAWTRIIKSSNFNFFCSFFCGSWTFLPFKTWTTNIDGWFLNYLVHFDY